MGNPASRISLLEAEPDLARFMSVEEQQEAAHVSVPVVRLSRGRVDLAHLLGEAHAFGALLLDGLLFSHHRVAEHTALRLLGPGDVLPLPGDWRSTILTDTRVSAGAATTLALYGNELLLAARRWPRIVAGFHVRLAEQSERLAAQLTICQFPRVDQRLLAVMWLLAETWGHVTSLGTRLPLSLTHDALGAMVGARRPTVTLALGELVERGAIVRQDRGWLLLEAPEAPSEADAPQPEHEILLDEAPTAWVGPRAQTGVELHDQLLATTQRLRAEHLAARASVRKHLAQLSADRAAAAESRRRIAAESLRRRVAPS
jgi:CRP-like cAMP-binding protein